MGVKSKCVSAIVEQLNPADGEKRATRKDVEEMIDALEAAAAAKDPRVLSEAKRLKLAARELTEADLKNAALEKRHRAINVLREKALEATVLNGTAKASTSLSRLMVGTTDYAVGAGNSQDARAHSYSSTMRGAVTTELRRAGVEQLVSGRGLLRARDPQFELDVRREMRRLNGSQAETPTGNHNAVKVATILNKYNAKQRADLNAAGATIGALDDFDVSQTHDPFKVSRFGLTRDNTRGMNRTQRFALAKSNWIDYVLPRLAERTFVGVADRRAFLSRIFDDLASGNHLGRDVPGLGGDFKFQGPGNLAKRLSHQRVLHFKDAEAAFNYNELAGQSSLFESFFYGIDGTGRDVETLSTWGVNPEAMFTKIVHRAINKAKEAGDLAEVQRLETGLQRTALTPGLKAQFDTVTGIGNIPGNPTVARWAQAIRTLQSMTKLGGMVLTSFSDIGVRAGVLRRNGINVFEALADGVQSIGRGRGGAELRDSMATLGIGIDGTMGSVMSRFTGMDNVPGQMSRMLGHFFRFNLSTYWQDAQMTGSGFMLSKNLANRAAQSFDELPPSLRSILQTYDIQQADWDVIRASGGQDVEGTRLMTAENITDEKVRKKLETYYVDQARESMTMGGAAERAWITNFGPPGSIGGEMARFFLQFKNFPLTFARRHLVGGMRKGDGWGVAQMIAMTTVMGYAAMAAKDLAKGKEPRDPTDPATWGAAFTQGGGLGIYGDFLLGEYDRFGRTLQETLAGPAAGDVANIVSLFAKIAVGVGGELTGEDVDWGKTGSRALSTAVGMTPFANLFYTRAALDYGILWHLQEAMDPGAMKRKEQAALRENNQRYIIKPTSVAGGL